MSTGESFCNVGSRELAVRGTCAFIYSCALFYFGWEIKRTGDSTAHGKGAIVSIDRVKTELADGADELTNWSCPTMPVECFKAMDGDTVIGRPLRPSSSTRIGHCGVTEGGEKAFRWKA